MSGHSKWSSIKHQKGKADAKRGQLFSKLARAIMVATREGGPDPALNLALYNAVEKARSYSMPKENIDRAIQRGGGQGSGEAYEAILYEGYGPAGVAVIVEVLTDNRNRSAADVRNIFSKHNGALGQPGAVVWIEAGADDVVVESDGFQVLTDPSQLAAVRDAIAAAGIAFEQAELTMIPKTTVQLDENDARRLLKLIDALEDNDDVQEVYANFDIPDDVLQSVAG
jgi:transcriptional/translational regulatory protein YebC/TACO1